MIAALALLFAGCNVFFRDFQSVVATISMMTMWLVPMIYPFEKLATSTLGQNPVFYHLYLSNPLAVGVVLVQRAFWLPTTLGEKGYPTDIDDIGISRLATGGRLPDFSRSETKVRVWNVRAYRRCRAAMQAGRAFHVIQAVRKGFG